MKEKGKKILILSLLIISYILVYFHFFSLHKTECILEEKEELYKKTQTIILKEKKGIVKEIIQKEKVFSRTPNILQIKQNEYEKKDYKIVKKKNKIIGTKKDK